MTTSTMMAWQVGRDLKTATEDGETTCCGSEECLASSYTSRPEIVRIAISATAAEPIQAYLTAYEKALARKNVTSNIQLNVLPSLQELQKDVRHDLSSGRGLYASYIVPPIMLGDLVELRGLASISLTGKSGAILRNVLDDLLPYYRTVISTFGGAIRGIPLLAGNQPLLLYRRDYLEAMNMTVPATWGDYVRVASVLHNQPLGTNGTGIYGSCMGRFSEAQCRKKMDQEKGTMCDSLSMSYLGMTIAPMTQRIGSSSGWLFDDDTEEGMESLLNPTLETALVFMEQQLKFGAPNEMEADSSLNLDLFRQGQCGMTVTIDHPVDLLMDEDVGFAPVPGSYTFLDRVGNVMMDCSPSTCPFGVPNEAGSTVNRVSYGAIDLLVGAISTYASDTATAAIKDFFSFIVDHDLSLGYLRQQPLTYSSLDASTIDGYKDVMLNITQSKNMAIPLRIPDAFSMFSELDNQVYEYLSTGNYSQAGRRMVRERVEASLQRFILQHDARRISLPMAVFYESSLDLYMPATSTIPDLYITKASRIAGWSLASLSCSCSLFFAWWVWRNKNHQVVRASQTIFLYMICFGTFLMAGSIFLFGVEDNFASLEATNRSCMGSMWLYSMGFVFTIIALSTKVWLINRVFRKARNLQRIKIEGVDLLGPFLFIGGFNLIIMMTWNISDPVVWERAPVEDSPSELNYEKDPTYGYCNSENYRVYLGLLLGVNYVVSVVSLVQAYECRMISTDYLESLWIGASLFVIVQIWSVGLPLLKLLDDNPNVVFLVKVGVILLTTMCTLLLIFLPKMDYLRESNSEPQKPSLQRHDSQKDHHSITSHESDDSPGKSKPYSTNMLGVSFKAMAKGSRQPQVPVGLEGIRIIQSSNRHSEELEKLQRGLRHAEARHKTLNDRLERLQEKLEQYIVSRHPNHLAHGSSRNFILSARSERVNYQVKGT